MPIERTLIIDGVRTPIGSQQGALAELTAPRLFELVLRELSDRLKEKLPPWRFKGFIGGNAFQNGLAPNIARVAWLKAGLPDTTIAETIHLQCGSGMKAVSHAMDEIALGHGDFFIAGGAESMSTVTYIAPANLRAKPGLNRLFSKWVPKIGPRIHVGLVDDGLAPLALINDESTVAMARTAQRLADQFEISRESLDEFAALSQERAARAIAGDRFKREIVSVLSSRGEVSRDEHPRATSREKLARLKPVLGTKSITAGNASGINDGACLLALGSESKVAKLGLEPLAALVDCVTVGLDPRVMGLGPVFAVREILARNKLLLDDIDLLELNEAFAAQYLACEKELHLDREKVNVNGGAIAFGHPIAMSGARLILTLAHELKARGLKRGIATLCIGGGMGIAMLIETL